MTIPSRKCSPNSAPDRVAEDLERPAETGREVEIVSPSQANDRATIGVSRKRVELAQQLPALLVQLGSIVVCIHVRQQAPSSATAAVQRDSVA